MWLIDWDYLAIRCGSWTLLVRFIPRAVVNESLS